MGFFRCKGSQENPLRASIMQLHKWLMAIWPCACEAPTRVTINNPVGWRTEVKTGKCVWVYLRVCAWLHVLKGIVRIHVFLLPGVCCAIQVGVHQRCQSGDFLLLFVVNQIEIQERLPGASTQLNTCHISIFKGSKIEKCVPQTPSPVSPLLSSKPLPELLIQPKY